MNLISKSLLSLLAIIFVVSCSNSMDDAEAQQTVYFNQFIPCKAGPDYSAETMKDFVAEWNELVAVYDEMVWAGGYAPASGQQGGWWELQWSSKEAADAAWESWLSNAEAQEWDRSSRNVLDCDNTQVGDFDLHGGVAAPDFDWTSFATQSQACRYTDGSTQADLMADMELFNKWVADNGNGDPYTYGVYIPQDSSDPYDFYWLNWHQNFDTMEAGNMNWVENGKEMQAIFDSHAVCDDAQLWNSAEFKNEMNS